MLRGSSTPSLAKYASLCAQNDGFVGVHYNKTPYISAYEPLPRRYNEPGFY